MPALHPADAIDSTVSMNALPGSNVSFHSRLSQRGSIRRNLLIAIVLLALLAGGWLFTRATPVAVLALTEAPLVESLLFTGRVGARSRVELGATTTGRIERVLVEEGAVVSAGQLLAELDGDEARAQLAQAQAALDGARARIASLGELTRPTAASGRAQAQATLAAARTEFDRTARLVEQGFLSQSRLDEARRQMSVAQAQLDAAGAQVRANAPAGSEAELARLRIAEAEAALDLAATRVDATRLGAPAAGRIILRAVEPGQVVQPGRMLFTMTLEGREQLVALVDERYLGRLAQGQRARVLADAYPEKPFDSKVATIAPGIDASRGAVEVKLDVIDPPAFLREDMTVSIEVVLARRERAATIPLAALRERDTVWQLLDGRIVATTISPGLRDQQRVEIVAGLAKDARIVVGPSPAPGARAREASAAANAAAARSPGRADSFNAGSALAPGQ